MNIVNSRRMYGLSGTQTSANRCPGKERSRIGNHVSHKT
jgi:hypothetical protein